MTGGFPTGEQCAMTCADAGSYFAKYAGEDAGSMSGTCFCMYKRLGEGCDEITEFSWEGTNWSTGEPMTSAYELY